MSFWSTMRNRFKIRRFIVRLKNLYNSTEKWMLLITSIISSCLRAKLTKRTLLLIMTSKRKK